MQLRLAIPELGLLGLLAVGSLSLYLHVFFPLSQLLAYGIFLVGLVMAIPRLPRSGWLWLLLLTLLFSFPTYMGGPQYDTGLYHLTSILWNTAQPLTFGLANLFVNLSFNSLWHVIASAVSLPGKENLGAFCLNSTLAVLVSWFGITKSMQKEQSGFLQHFLLFFSTAYLVQLLFAPVIQLETNPLTFPLSGPSNDFPANSIGIVAVYFLLKSFVNGSTDVTLRKAVLFSFFASLIKLSMLPLFLSSFFLLVWHTRGKYIRLHRTEVGLLFTVGIAWLAHSIVMSGCVLPVLPVTCIEAFPWSAHSIVESGSLWVRSWARNPFSSPDEVLRNYDWIQEYWWAYIQRIPTINIGFLSLLFFLFLQFHQLLRLKTVGILNIAAFKMLGVFFLFFLFWFFSAPDYRFVSGMFLAFATLLTAAVTSQFPIQIKPRLIQSFFLVLIALFLVRIGWNMLLYYDGISLPWPDYQKVETEKTTVRGGEILLPKSGDQCFDAGLFCTPQHLDDLEINMYKKQYYFTLISQL
ncbi:MAG: hypothetical protein O2840_01860 [bacterium]|nr:hypothetical protein [bacterium]